MNEAGIRDLLEQHHVAGYGWALSCCSRNPDMAQEVLQTVYLKILQDKARFNGDASFRTWLFSVIRKTAAEEHRRVLFRRMKLLAYEQHHRPSPGGETPAERLDRAERKAMFRGTIAALPRRQREVLHLVFFEDMAIEEAARVMGVSLGSARTHYERGKKRLRERLAESGDLL